ncbi:hypothetical protein FTO60_09275 [Octadecabacter sp. SW4]|uniref:hypothetical protein n=1 Tax=Octadecabacter sp. SW4 TaxID=2602067 RepID=UPI0011C1D340|nr:hypothetical protein [Octadecabacter sp. SW4]QEE35879.1 hypothetical protein FTO60_09275 [Octadecabacter sp. SW4]
MPTPQPLARAVGQMRLRDHVSRDDLPGGAVLRQQRRHRIFQITDQHAAHQEPITSARAGPAP